ncbi:MAG: hypothetical protein ACRCVT_05845 [Leadbetterella sp.]
MNKKKSISACLIVLGCCFTASLFAQKKDTLQKPIKNILKTTPGLIFDFDNTFTIGWEHFLKPDKSIQSEFGYGNTNQNLLIGIFETYESSEFKNYDVYRGKVEMKKYFNRNSKFETPKAYMAIEIFGKFLRKSQEITVGKLVTNGTPEYYENISARYKKNVFGSHLKLGHPFTITKYSKSKNPKLIIDLYAGIGFRRIQNDIEYVGKSDTDLFWNEFRTIGGIFRYNDESIYIISATAGFKLGYVL